MIDIDLNNNSRVWVYTSPRPLTQGEVDFLQSEMNAFTSEWNAHGAGLTSKALIVEERFLVFVVDESKVAASGCSIDKSVAFVKSMGGQLSIDFFDRMNVWILNKDKFEYIHFSDLRNYPDALIYNPMITSLKELKESWLIKVSTSSFV